MDIPEDRGYTTDHEWLLPGNPATVGITAFAADALGDVVYVDLPTTGTTVQRGGACGEIESTKSVSDLFAPADGVVVAVNEQLHTEPELVNRDPYGDGWLFRLEIQGEPPVLDAAAYRNHIS